MTAMVLDFGDEPKVVEPPMYIECEHPQGSEGWFLDRLGVPTGSGFKNILTPSGAYSTAADSYMNDLLAEWITEEPLESFQGYHMKRGNELEPEAAELYQFITDSDVREIGFCFANSKKMYGVSPDRMVDADGLLEIKCPKANTMIEYKRANELPALYKPQVQGQLMVMQRQWCDFFCYHPKVPHMKIRVERDEGYIKLLSDALEAFNGRMLKERAKLS